MDAQIDTDRRGRKSVRSPCLAPCAIERGVRAVAGKWTGSILWHLREGPVRFNDLARLLGGASKKVLTQRLAEMAAAGLITREVVALKPLAVQYLITPRGAGALEALALLKTWVEEEGL